MHRLSIHKFLKHSIYTFTFTHKGDGARELRRREARGGGIEVWKDEGEKTEFFESGAPCITYRGPGGQSRISMGQGECNPPACGR